MQGYFLRRLGAVVMAFALIATASAGEVLSTMRNVSAVAEAHGFRLNIVHDTQIAQLPSDLSPPQAFEILRPDGKPVTVGRLFTSCSCIQLESPKRTFNPGERAILTLRNIKPTPPAGQVYAVFVQITSPVRTTLRFDTYVQSGMAGGMPFENAAATGTTPTGTTATATKSGAATLAKGYQGSAHADAVAALTRQIDQGFATASRQSAVETTAPMMPPAAPGSAASEKIEAVVEASEAAPAAAGKIVGREIEAAELPAPLPPPEELTARAGQAVTAVTEQVEALPKLDALPELTTARVDAVATAVAEQAGLFAEEDEDEDFEEEFAAVPSPAPRQATVPGQPLPRTLTIEELERELRNDAEERYAKERVATDLANLKLSTHEEDDDLGTANLLSDLKDAREYYAEQAGQVPQVAREAAEELRTEAVAQVAVQTGLPAETAAYAPAAVISAAPGVGAAIVEEIAPGGNSAAYWDAEREQAAYRAEQLQAAGDNLPPPPGLTTPTVSVGTELLQTSEVVTPLPSSLVQGVPDANVTAYIPQQEPVRATLQPVVQETVAPLAVVTEAPDPGYGYEPGTPEPRPQQVSSRKPVQAVSLITVGVRDMAKAIRFYEALGWRRAARGKYDQTAFFQLQGQILALYPMHDLLREQNMPEASPAPGGITLALHVLERSDVWSVYQRFIDAGGASLRAPAEMASGAVTSYVADPDGNAWEISWVPQFRIDEEGGLWLP